MRITARKDGTLFTEVSKEAFYAAIGPQNVTPSIVTGSYPYTSEFITPCREVRGRKVGYMPDGEGLAKYRYFLRARSGCSVRYVSDEFGEELVIERRMPNTVDVRVWDGRRGNRWHRWSRSDLAAYLRGCGFRRISKSA